MKKAMSVFVIIVIALSVWSASAEEILFRDMEWGCTLKEAVYSIADGADKLFVKTGSGIETEIVSTTEDFSESDCSIRIDADKYGGHVPAMDSEGIIRTEAVEGTTITASIGFNDQLQVAGHDVQKINLHSIADSEDADSSRVYSAEYVFFYDKETAEDLYAKLDVMYEGYQGVEVYDGMDLAIRTQVNKAGIESDISNLTPIGKAWLGDNSGVMITWKDAEEKYAQFSITYWGYEPLRTFEAEQKATIDSNFDGL